MVKRKQKFNFSLIFSLVILDQLVKFIFLKFFPQAVNFNRGVSFGLLPSNAWTVINILILMAVYFFSFFTDYWGLNLLLSGGLSNLCDRLIRGKIIDFISLSLFGKINFPSFNLADVFITIGLISCLITHVKARPLH